MAEQIKAGNVRLLSSEKDIISRELSLLRYDNIERDKIEIESKEQMKKRNNGKSPDILDSIMMRFVFLIKKHNNIIVR